MKDELGGKARASPNDPMPGCRFLLTTIQTGRRAANTCVLAVFRRR